MDRHFILVLTGSTARNIRIKNYRSRTNTNINFFEELKKRVDNGNAEEYIIDEQLKKCSNIERWQQYG